METVVVPTGTMGPIMRDDPCFPLEMLLSPVIDDRNNEFVEEDIGSEMLKVSLENLLKTLVSPVPDWFGQVIGFVKSRVRVCDSGGCCCGTCFRGIVGKGAIDDGEERFRICGAAAEVGVVGVVEDRDDLLELRDGEVSDLAIV